MDWKFLLTYDFFKGRNTYVFLCIIVVLFSYSCKQHKEVAVISPSIEDKVVAVMEKKEMPKQKKETMTSFLSEYLKLKYKNKDFSKYIYVSVKHQQLYLIENDSTVKEYPISTAKKGVGSRQDSYKTPPGLHIIKRKIGEGVPFGGILESRVYTGKIANILTERKNAPKDYVTSRIMWLQGEELGLNRGRNVDSYNRYIYIHGTPEEGFIGEPASHGCIRMKNTDVIELYDLVSENTPILILKY